MAQQGEIDRLTQEIENLNEQKDALSNVNDERQRELDLIKAKEALAVNPLHLRALERAGMCIALLIDSGDTSYSMDEAYLYFDRAMRIYNTIAMTGLGDEEYPFCVTSVADEYEFMRNYLELYEYESQALVGVCDVFTLKETSEYYSDKTIYFDATRPLEMLAKALRQ